MVRMVCREILLKFVFFLVLFAVFERIGNVPTSACARSPALWVLNRKNHERAKHL